MKKLLIIVLSLFCLMGCAKHLMEVNPNVNTPLDASKLEAQVLTDWYLDMYLLAVNMNNDITLSEDSRKILENELNPSLDTFKEYLVTYINNIQSIEENPINPIIDTQRLQNLSNKLAIMKGFILKYLVSMEDK